MSFQEQQIGSPDEKLDRRFTSAGGTRARNDREATSKLSIEDVELAKPEASKDPNAQPIPLEYRDLLR